MRHAFVFSQKTFTEAFKDEDITSLQYGAVDLVSFNPGVGHKAVAAALSTAPSILTTALKPLLTSGNITNEPRPGDRRQSAYHLSEAAKTWFRPLKRRLRKADTSLTAGLSAAEADRLKKALLALTGRIA